MMKTTLKVNREKSQKERGGELISLLLLLHSNILIIPIFFFNINYRGLSYSRSWCWNCEKKKA